MLRDDEFADDLGGISACVFHEDDRGDLGFGDGELIDAANLLTSKVGHDVAP